MQLGWFRRSSLTIALGLSLGFASPVLFGDSPVAVAHAKKKKKKKKNHEKRGNRGATVGQRSGIGCFFLLRKKGDIVGEVGVRE